MAEGFPTEEMEVTHLLVVSDLTRSVPFYRDVLGAELYREYGGTSAVFRLLGNWLLVVTGGGPTDDKPTVTLAPPVDRGGEIRAFFRDPDGYLFEISELVSRG